MEGFEFMNAMKGISPELLKDPGAQNQMKNFWNMLDEMAANNPDEYSNFIKKNLENGMEEIKKDSGKEKVQSDFAFCIKTYTELKKEIVLINVCYSEKVLRPLDKDKNIADVDELDTWTTIPTSFSQKKEKRTQGKKPMRFYDAIVHCAVAEYAKKDLRYKGHIVSSICHRLELKEKIVLLFDKGEFDYFETYKGPADEKSPQAQFLELAADPDEYSKYLKSKKYLAMQEKIRENTIGDVLVTNKPKKSCNIEVVPKVLEKSEEVIKVAAVEKKILIEEIKNFKVEIDAVKKNGNVEVNEKESIIEIQADLPGEAGMKGVTLEATKKSIRLHCTSFAFQVDFLNYQLEDAQISAKWVKTKKRLLIACPYSK